MAKSKKTVVKEPTLLEKLKSHLPNTKEGKVVLAVVVVLLVLAVVL